jgi:hypothetical protein
MTPAFFLLVEIGLVAFISRRRRKFARQVLALGFVMVAVEMAGIFLGGFNEKYFHVAILDEALKIYFALVNLYLVLILGTMITLAGLLGLWIRRSGD